MPSLRDMRGRAKEAGLMKLDRLIASRQRIPDCPLSIPIRELCTRYEKLYTGCINDVLREFTLLDQNLPSDIMPLRDEMVVCGEAFTVKSAPNVMIEGEMTFRAQMLDDFKPEGVVVWDTSGDVEASLWGGVMTATAITKASAAPSSRAGSATRNRSWNSNSQCFTSIAPATVRWGDA